MADGPRHVLIAGPTASGKSDLAVQVAKEIGGHVINADSQQVYREWQILTARPSVDEMEGVPHWLYGHVGLEEGYSVGRWLDEVRPLLATRCVIAGGTGLYFKALREGLAAIPPIPAGVCAEAEHLLETIGSEALAERLTSADPDTAARIDLVNPRRVLRAWQVLQATGTGLAEWQRNTPDPLLASGSYQTIALVPDRAWLYARCEARFDAMIERGALDEAERVLQMATRPARNDFKAVGASALIACLQGELTLDDAIARAKTETRRYAKRQLTWIRNQMTDWRQVDPSAQSGIETLINSFGQLGSR